MTSSWRGCLPLLARGDFRMLTYPFLPWLMMRAVLWGTETQSEEPVMGSLETIATRVPTSPYFKEYCPSPVATQICFTTSTLEATQHIKLLCAGSGACIRHKQSQCVNMFVVL